MNFSAKVSGVDHVQDNLQGVVDDMRGETFRDGMRDATLIVSADAKINAPVSEGRLRASITPEVRQAFGGETQGVVGSNVLYSAFVELGTRPHWPPLAALVTWAQRHGMTAYQVAKSIATKGTAAVKYLQNALDSNRKRIEDILETTISKIVVKGNR